MGPKEEKKEEEEKKDEPMEEKKEEETKEEEEEEEEEPEEPEEEEKEEKLEDLMDVDEEPPKVELSDEDKKAWFYKGTPDLVPYLLSTTFTKFSIPEKAEGFDDIRYEWQKAPKCADHLKEWKLEKKVQLKIEDLRPGEWFQAESQKFNRAN